MIGKMQRLGGFTLIEMAMVTLIIGILMGPLLLLYRSSVSNKQLEVTNENLQLASEALTEFAGNNERYPCPARLDLGPGDPFYGVPDCRDGFGYSGFTEPTTPGDCHAGICRATGFRDLDGDGTNDPILIGAVPFQIMNEGDTVGAPPNIPPSIKNSVMLPASEVIDGWGRKLTYAVTESMTDSASFSVYSGVIEAVDENGKSLLDKPGTAHFALISHGDDGSGAYTTQGKLVEDCKIGEIDSKNCQQLGTVVSGLRSLASGTNYNDDVVKYISYTASSIWTASSMVEGAIYNVPGGRVGIGTEDPNDMLEVAGNLQALELHTKEFCGLADDPDECYDPAIIAGDVPAANGGLRCPSGQVLQAIQNKTPVCITPSVAAGNASCPAGQVVVGVSNFGNVKCCPLNAGVLNCPP